MNELPSRFILWFRMQSFRQDAIGGMVRTVHADHELLSKNMHSAVLRHLQATESHKGYLPLFWEATQEFDRYHKRQFDDMPCLVCRQSLAAIPREEINVIWIYRYGLESGTYAFLHKPCFVRIDQTALAVESLKTLLSPQHDYRRHLTNGWWEALVRLWPLKKPPKKSLKKSLAVRAVVLPAPGRALPLSTRFDILKRDKYRCRLCGAAARDSDHVRLEVDHITARFYGGTDDESNLWTLCFACNRGKGTKDL